MQSIGGQISDVTLSAVENTMASLGQLWRQLAATPEIFAALSLFGAQCAVGILANVAALVVLTYGGLFLMRRLVRIPRERLRALFQFRRLDRQAVARFSNSCSTCWRRPFPMPWLWHRGGVSRRGRGNPARACALSQCVPDGRNRDGDHPDHCFAHLPEQRLVHLSDGEAKSVMGWSRFIISLFVFGQMMVLPLIAASVSFAAGGPFRLSFCF